MLLKFNTFLNQHQLSKVESSSVRGFTPFLLPENCRCSLKDQGNDRKYSVEKEESSASNMVVYIIQVSVSWKLGQYTYNEVPISGLFLWKCCEYTYVVFWNSWIWCGDIHEHYLKFSKLTWKIITEYAYAIDLIAKVKTNIQVAVSLELIWFNIHKVRGNK